MPDTLPAPTDPRRGALLANLLAQLAFGLLAMTICLPSMQEWGAIFGVGQPAVQLTFSAYVLTYGGLQLFYGPLSDRLGRRRILLFGLALSLAGALAAALAPGLAVLVAARALQGAGAAAGMVVGRAMVQDLFTGPERTRVMAYIGMTLGLCPPLATLIGGQLHVRWGWQANFWLIALLAALLWGLSWRMLPRQAHRPAVPVTPGGGDHWLRAMGQAYLQLAREPRFVAYVAILAMTTATFYAFLGGAPVVLRSLGVGPEGIGLYIMCVPMSYIAGSFLTSRIVHRLGERRMLRAGQALTLAGIALMLGLGLAGWHSALALSLPLMLLGVGHGLLVPPALAGTVGLLPALAGSAAAVAGVSQQLMGALGGYLVGLMPHHGVVNLGWLMLGLAACASVPMMLMPPAAPTRPAGH
ncbi:Bcr/CflA family efflux MFS transporter [Sphaerotilus microaerophilus]|uniref:Bcr/CflA family efflux transporter n=1 Tax=Sphaerotilus microaerophilus TaxID=2914710 RepID=A0ABM7YMA3_9BURK|nr:Bcr/CflA family efflux MFS transporter [Sphaerotilus sp. FB-5]BDI05564.1 Bcr/CflA family drug resistance efflux transporter [Sphaerotilus sp. FB-5]